jgi:hypothetical protein
MSLLPYDEGMRRLPEVMNSLKKNIMRPDAVMSGQGGVPIAALLLPSLENVLRTEVRMTREYAALQAIEALRMHAAASDGKLPASLSVVTIVPVPKDPASGQPFLYKYDADSGEATLDVPPMSGWPARGIAKRYVIGMRK